MYRVKRVLIFVVQFILFYTFVSYGAYNLSESSIYATSTSTGYTTAKDHVKFSQFLEISNKSVKFTQDDNNYYFEIKGNSIFKPYDNSYKFKYDSWHSGVYPMFYKSKNFGNNMIIFEEEKTPHADFRSGSVEGKSGIVILGNAVFDHSYSYNVSAGTNITNDHFNITGNGDKYYIPNGLRNKRCASSICYKYKTNYPFESYYTASDISIVSNLSNSECRHDDGVNYSGDYILVYRANYNAKIRIKKNCIDDYRYMCFAETYAMSESENSNNYTISCKGCSLCTDTIDLKEYIDCKHNWKIEYDDKLTHKMYCKECQWNKSENHDLLYEYDGIKNNICTCSYIEKVNCKFIINDDYTDEVNEISNSYSDYVKHQYVHKTGYNFLWYEKYKTEIIDIDNLSTVSNATKKVFIATCSDFDKETEKASMTYKAIYNPIKFIFNYSNKSNIDDLLIKNIEKQEIYYDETVKIKNNVDCKGYAFKGWSLASGSEIIDFEPLQDITNYTDVDLKEYTLYPIYEKMDYYINYKTSAGKFSDGSREKTVKYDYFFKGKLETPILSSEEEYFKYYVDDSGRRFLNLNDVVKYIDEIRIPGTRLNLNVVIGRYEYGSPEKTNSKGPGGKLPSGNNTLPIISSNDINPLQIVNETESIMFHETEINSKIEGMSKSIKLKKETKKEIESDEESIDDEKSEEESDEIIATLSIAKWMNERKNRNNDKINYSIFENILSIFKQNGTTILLAIVVFIMLIVYEFSIVKYFSKKIADSI